MNRFTFEKTKFAAQKIDASFNEEEVKQEMQELLHNPSFLKEVLSVKLRPELPNICAMLHMMLSIGYELGQSEQFAGKMTEQARDISCPHCGSGEGQAHAGHCAIMHKQSNQ